MLSENPKISQRLEQARGTLKSFLDNFNNGTIKSFVAKVRNELDRVQIRHSKATGAEYRLGQIIPTEPSATLLFQDKDEIIQLEVQLIEKGEEIILLLYENPALEQYTRDTTKGLKGCIECFAAKLKEVLGAENLPGFGGLEDLKRNLATEGKEGFIQHAERFNFKNPDSVIKIFHNRFRAGK